MPKTRIGNQTPTQAVFKNFKKSRYKEAVEIYKKTKRKCQKWQINLLKSLLAVNSKGLWIHTKFGYSLPRRNGKNEVVVMRELWALMNGEQVLHTAHRTSTSHSAWERLIRLLDQAGIAYESLRASGRERVEVAETGGRVEFRTRTTTGGLGEGFDLLVIDEAQEYTTDQESALKYVVTDSKNPQTIFCGTPPTPLSSGTVFVNYRKKALAGEIENGAWAEWGVETETDPHDKESWYLCNPSLGTIFTERSINDEIGEDKLDFNIQRLGLWIKYNLKSTFSENDWGALQVDPKTINLTGKLFAGVKYGHSGDNVSLSIAVKTDYGHVFVEALDCRSVREGNDWLLSFLTKAQLENITIDGANGQTILSQQLKEYKVRNVVLPTTNDVITAGALWEQGIFSQDICHAGQLSLKRVVTNCTKRTIGSKGGFGFSAIYEDSDVSLMESAILAHWACKTSKPKIKQRITY